MKKRLLLLPLGCAMAFFTLQSDSGGPYSNYTGSHGGTAGCASCHGTSAITGMHLGVELDSAGIPVTTYTPGFTYKIKISDTNTTTYTLPKFGFELSCVTGSGSTSVTAGTYGTTPSGTRISTSGVTFWEHSTPLLPISGTGGTGTIYADSISWTAPAAGSGTVTMFLVMNAVNGNGTDDAGDKWNIKNVAITERNSTNAVSTVTNVPCISVYPNPATSSMNIALNNVDGSYKLSVYNSLGQLITLQSVNANGKTTITLNSANWAAGTYNVVVEKEGYRKTLQVVKQ